MDISFLLAILSLFLGTLSLFLAVKTARKIYKKKKERNTYWKEHLEIEEIQRLTRPRTIVHNIPIGPEFQVRPGQLPFPGRTCETCRFYGITQDPDDYTDRPYCKHESGMKQNPRNPKYFFEAIFLVFPNSPACKDYQEIEPKGATTNAETN